MRNLSKSSTRCVQTLNVRIPVVDGMNRGALKEALERLKAGDDRSEIIDDTFDAMELL